MNERLAQIADILRKHGIKCKITDKGVHAEFFYRTKHGAFATYDETITSFREVTAFISMFNRL